LASDTLEPGDETRIQGRKKGVHPRCRGRLSPRPVRQARSWSALQLLLPVAAPLLARERATLQGDEVAEGRGGGRQQWVGVRPASLAVELEELGEHGGDAPAVEDGMVLRPEQLEELLVQVVDAEAQERRTRPVEPPSLFRQKGLLQESFLLRNANP